jgi:hypothetical protein
MPLILVTNDVDTPPVHCQRHIYVYHFVYLRPTQAAHEYSIEAALGGRERLLRSCDCYSIRGDNLGVGYAFSCCIYLQTSKTERTR